MRLDGVGERTDRTPTLARRHSGEGRRSLLEPGAPIDELRTDEQTNGHFGTRSATWLSHVSDDSRTPRPVVFVGNATRDSMFFVSHLPADDEVCAVGREIRCLGGRGVIPALVAGALGMNSELCTVIGHDLRVEFGDFLDSNSVGTSGVKWDAHNSGVTQYVAFIGEQTGASAAVAKAAELDWKSVESQRVLMRRAKAAYFSTNDLDFNLELLSSVSDGLLVVHNLGVRLAGRPDYIDAMLMRSTLLVGNRLEIADLKSLTGLTPDDMLDSSPSLKNVIVTMGREGAQVFGSSGDSPIEYPPVTRNVVRSPVGAGDSFAVGVLYSMVSGKTLTDGIRLGMALGALAVESELSYPDLARVAEVPW
jgi:sugar/nucleoside kinase (ribokinase family)